MKLDHREWMAVGLILLVVLGEGWLLLRDRTPPREEVRATLDLAEAMGGADTTGYARALEPRPFIFPGDHGPHPEYRTEWWYVTANLEAPDGRRFGVQFTLFRSALAPEAGAGDGMAGQAGDAPGGEGMAPGASLSTRQVYMGHFAVTDVAGDAFHEAERFTRAAGGLAGGTADPLRIWLDDWSLTGGGEADPDAPGAGAVFPLTVSAALDPATEGTTGASVPVGVRLSLAPAKPLVIQGDRGLSRKGPEPGNASFYYSFTRLEASGTVTVDGVPHAVAGTAWLDREWSTSALSAEQEGWDWFALQLDDGRDLMVYRLRQRDGGTDPLSEGVLVEADGAVRRLSAEEFALAETGSWESPLDGTVYPSGWRVVVPGEGVDLTVTPVRQDQELNVSVRYWEGAVEVEGTGPSGALRGRGYVELTGYSPPTGGGDPGSRRFKPTG